MNQSMRIATAEMAPLLRVLIIDHVISIKMSRRKYLSIVGEEVADSLGCLGIANRLTGLGEARTDGEAINARVFDTAGALTNKSAAIIIKEIDAQMHI